MSFKPGAGSSPGLPEFAFGRSHQTSMNNTGSFQNSHGEIITDFPRKVDQVTKQKDTLSTQMTIRSLGAWLCRNRTNRTCLAVRKSLLKCIVSREASRQILPHPNFNSAVTFQEFKGTMTHLSFTLTIRTFRSRIALSTEICLLGSTKEIHYLPNSRVW